MIVVMMLWEHEHGNHDAAILHHKYLRAGADLHRML